MIRIPAARMALVGLTLMAGTPVVRGEADAILPLIPEKAEVVVSLNLRKLAGTEAFRRIQETPQCERLRNKIQGFATLTGMDPRKDLDRATFFGAVDGDKHTVFAVQGRINKDRLLQLVKLNEHYEATESGGVTIHSWRDDKEKREKYGAFFDNGVIAIANSKESMEAVIATHADPALSLNAPEGQKKKYIPAGAGEAVVWAILPRSGRETKSEKPMSTLGIEAVSVVADLSSSDVAATATAHMAGAAEAAEMQQILEGAVAAGRLQKAKPVVSAVARNARALPAEGSTASLTVAVPLDQFMERVTAVLCRR